MNQVLCPHLREPSPNKTSIRFLRSLLPLTYDDCSHMLISEFEFELPEALIAQSPLERRDASRMLVLNRLTGVWEDRHFTDLPSLLQPGDVLVVNNTRVFPARLMGHRIPSGGKAEIFLVKQVQERIWEALVKPGRRLKEGTLVGFEGVDLTATIGETTDEGRKLVHFETARDFYDVLGEAGQPPLPPYIKRESGPTNADDKRYQTIFASQRGAIAAPTAGLHFTDEVRQQVKDRGVSLAEVTLHVGYGTFKPVQVTDVARHAVDPEYASIDEMNAERINTAIANGGKVVAVGTTSTRALEGFAQEDGLVRSGNGYLDLTIVPGYSFKVVDYLLTNFHLPGSSLLLLVSALAGKDAVMGAYAHAVAEKYRFYSYGDCMLIM